MKYIYEITKNSTILASDVRYASHPNQVVRAAVNKAKGLGITNYIVYVLNEIGERWVFSVMYSQSKNFARLMKRLDVMDIDQVDLVFTGNLSIVGG